MSGADQVAQTFEKMWAHYALPQPQGWSRTAQGANSTTWIVSLADRSKVVVRRYPPSIESEGIRYEHSILRHLARHAFPSPRLIPARGDEGCVKIGDAWFALFEYCEGKSLDRMVFLLRTLRPALITEAGTTLAQFHRLMEGFVPEGARPRRDSRWFIGELRRYRDRLGSNNGLTRYDRHVLQDVVQVEDWLNELSPLWMPGNHQVIIHGDFSPSNLLFRSGRVSAVLDFTKARLGDRVADVAQAIALFARRLGPGVEMATAKRFLQAYQAQHPLTEEELTLLPRWMLLGRLVAWWWHLTKFYDEGCADYGPKTIRTMALARWIKINEAQLRTLGAAT